MAPNSFSLKFLKSLFVSEKDDEAVAFRLRKAIEKAEKKERVITASSLEQRDVVKMFDLVDRSSWAVGVGKNKGDQEVWLIDMEILDEVPQSLIETRETIEFAVEGSANNEARTRSLLDPIFSYAIVAEKNRAKTQEDRNLAKMLATTSLATTSSARPVTPSKKDPVAHVSLGFESTLNCEVTWRNETCILTGRSDYHLVYDGTDDMTTNLVVMEAKKDGGVGSARGQLLAYMAMVQRQRMLAQKGNVVVWGISTDAIDFTFWRLDNEKTITNSPPVRWDAHATQRKMVYHYVRHIVRAAIQSSPRTSPQKPGQEMKDSLERFSVANSSFDYGDWSLPDEDVELADPSDFEE